MKLVVDGMLFERQTKGGISQIYAEILPRMCDLDPTLQVALYTRQDRLLVDPPQHPQLIHKIIPRVEYYLRPQRLWKRCYPQARRMLSRWCYGSGQGAIWHSTFFTTPGPW